MNKTVAHDSNVFATLGCRLNACETTHMKALTKAATVNNLVVVNTCAVTAQAVRNSKKRIRQLRRDNPTACLIVTGCAAQTEPATYTAMNEVDLVFGNAEKNRKQTWQSLAADFNLNGKANPLQVNNIMSINSIRQQMALGLSNRARAYVKIQNGCNHRCTFCIIPFGRGNSRSVPAKIIVEQIKRLVNNGYNEVVLTGVDLTAWGVDLSPHLRLGDLVQKILHLNPDLARLRLSSIDSIEVDNRLHDAIASESRLMPHLHLSLQSGDNMILKRMKRRHTREYAVQFCQNIAKIRPDIVFGADLIAGFPTETEEMFQNTYRLIAECNLTRLHVFPFSPRDGTPAARMPQIQAQIIKQRAAKLRKAGAQMVKTYLKAQVGKKYSVLMETPRVGRSTDFCQVHFATDHKKGAIILTRIIAATDIHLFAESVPP